MKKMTWDKFYNEFYSLSPEELKSCLSTLTDFGPADKVFEIASELSFTDKALATQLVDRALDAGVRFTPADVLDMTLLIDKPVLSRMAEQTVAPFDRNQLEEIYLLIDDASFERISKRAAIDILSEDISEPYEETHPGGVTSQPKKPGFFTRLLEIMACEVLFGDFFSNRRNDDRH